MKRLLTIGLVMSCLIQSVFAVEEVDDTQSDDMKHLDKISKRDKVDETVEKALAYLMTQQDPVKGSFKGDKPNALTALSCMAMMAAGHFPGRSKYGENLRRGVMFLTRSGKQYNGYYGNESNARMYGHGMCALALCEAYGMMQDEKENMKVKKACEAAIKVILHAQAKSGNNKGGWRYSPQPGAADLSVTAWQILALRAAQNCQLEVPDKAIEDAIGYLKRSYHVGGKGCGYTPGGGPSVAMRSAGIVCMQALGVNKTKEEKAMVSNAAAYLTTLNPSGGSYFYYQSYYLATAANVAGKQYRDIFLPKMEKVLLDLQMPSGEMKKHSGAQGGVYSTAFGVICLAVGYQYLPIYQE